jgi:hypothetical protein
LYRTGPNAGSYTSDWRCKRLYISTRYQC